MSSQEDYLDQLLRNIMNGGQESPQAEPAAEAEDTARTEPAAGAEDTARTEEGLPEQEVFSGMMEDFAEILGDIPEATDMADMSGVPEVTDMADMSGVPEATDMADMSGMPEATDMADMSGVPEVTDMADMSGVPEVTDMADMSGMPEVTDMADMSGMPEVIDMADMSGMPEVIDMADMSGMPEVTDMPDMSGILGVTDMPDMSEILGVSDMPDMPGMAEAQQDIPEQTEFADESPAAMNELTGEADLFPTMGAMDDVPAELFENMESFTEMPEMSVDIPEVTELPVDIPDFSGIAQEASGTFDEGDDDITELLKSFEDTMDISAEKDEDTEKAADISPFDLSDIMSGEEEEVPEAAGIASMSEEDIEKLLAESRGTAEDRAGSAQEEYQGDVVDLLKGTDDGELQEIQNLLEKSDNNEAVGDEIEALLRGAVQDSYQNSSGGYHAGTGTDDNEGAEEQLSPGQKKAMEKKRVKEEKAAARKAEKEARKAEKAARKAARKAGKGADSIQDAGNAQEAAQGAAAETVDTTFLDSILSEAGKIDGTETISSATGNYEVEIDNLIPEGGEDDSDAKKEKSVSSLNDDLGIDMDKLFGDSSGAESAMLADGGEEFPGFVALDGDDVSGIIQLAGEDEEESKPKKKGFFSRFLEFLTEEEEEEEENENIRLSEENQEIIEELDKEKKKENKKGKKGKKKAAKAEASAEEGEEDAEGGEDKKEKKKKAKKPKKEKVPKEKEPVDPRNRISLKKAFPVILICVSLGLAIIIITYASVNFMDKKAARTAYYAGDYQTCYQNLYGKDLNESEQIMFGKAKSVLTVRLWIREYEVLASEGDRLEALDILIQSVNEYPVLYEYAGHCNATGEVAQEYATLLNLLYENYGLTEDQARAIAAETDDIEYTRQVNAIAQGGAYGSWNAPEPVVDVPLPDELPEEAELPEGNFIDTNASVQ